MHPIKYHPTLQLIQCSFNQTSASALGVFSCTLFKPKFALAVITLSSSIPVRYSLYPVSNTCQENWEIFFSFAGNPVTSISGVNGNPNPLTLPGSGTTVFPLPGSFPWAAGARGNILFKSIPKLQFWNFDTRRKFFDSLNLLNCLPKLFKLVFHSSFYHNFKQV